MSASGRVLLETLPPTAGMKFTAFDIKRLRILVFLCPNGVSEFNEQDGEWSHRRRFSEGGVIRRTALVVIRIPVDQLWNNWETRPKGVGKRMTVRSGGTEAKRRGCNGLTVIHMSIGECPLCSFFVARHPRHIAGLGNKSAPTAYCAKN